MWSNEYNDKNVDMSQILFYAIHKRVSSCDTKKYESIVKHDNILSEVMTRFLKYKNCDV